MRAVSFLLALSWSATLAGDVAADSLTKAELADLLPGVGHDQVTDSPIGGVYEIAVGTNVAYVSDDGKYLLQGELYDLDSNENLTELRRSQVRMDLLSGLSEEGMIIFGPSQGKAKHSVVVFTDIDCGYCRKLHREIQQVNELGIEVKYVFFPRSGPGTESWQKAGNVWCSANRNAALTTAKAGGDVPASKCEGTPIQSQYDLGRQAGVRGTPAIFNEEGVQIGGYLPAEAMLGRLDALAASTE